MAYWPWWATGLALAGVMVGHWLVLRRMMGVSGRYTAMVDRIVGAPDEDAGDMSMEELAEALRAATLAEFGEGAVEEVPANIPVPVMPPVTPLGVHVLFFVGLLAGGILSALLAGTWSPVTALSGAGFTTLVRHSSLVGPVVLVAGGMLVGFGTRMATGCTSGHGLCGTSRFQPGSWLATAAFFGTGVAASFLLGSLM
jgi:uncharacterized membrane protein YedE/YeeE